jgi:monoterpene epsilon-lactone hydrolase
MISKEAQISKSKLQKEVIDPSVSLANERSGWDDYASTLPLAENVSSEAEKIAGVDCLWLSCDQVVDDKLLVYAHGGGLVVGSITTHRTFVSFLAKTIGRKVLMVGYGLLPEHDFSKPMADITAVYSALIDEKHIDPSQIYFAGDSSGAGAALSSLVHLRDLGRKLPNGFIALSGAFDVSLQGATMMTNDQSDPVLSYEVLKHWQKQYFEGKIDLDHPHISPLFSSLYNLPEMFLVAGGDEVWLDDSVRLAKSVRQVGGTAHLKIFDKMWHVFQMDTELPESHLNMRQIKTFLDIGSVDD